jgi:uncharacterized protein (DUF1778 family)
VGKKPINVKLDEELIKQIQDAAKTQGATLTDFVRNAIVKELRAQDALPEIRELIKQQLNMYRGFMAKLDTIIELMQRRS